MLDAKAGVHPVHHVEGFRFGDNEAADDREMPRKDLAEAAVEIVDKLAVVLGLE